ncbi:hypothetical protein A8A54_19175 [Brucella pseudogrignonensis]|nr:hypothetical protein A8A54_19175 [Brucella pseudogrignonensis]
MLSARNQALVRTPLLESSRVNAMLGGRLLLKAEGLQVTGSFKARGAFNRIASLTQEERARGVIAYSSGNHAQAVAWAASHFGLKPLILMPSTAPRIKLERTRAMGAVVEQHDWRCIVPKDLCQKIALERNLVIIPPFEDRRVLAGAATLGVELVEQASAKGVESLDAVITGCSGGGLLAATALSVRTLSPSTELWGAEPRGYEDLAMSLAKGERVSILPEADTICDALTARSTGELTFAILKETLSGAYAVTDDDVLSAIRFAFEEFRVVLEPGGAAALAAVLNGRAALKGRCVAIVGSGANIDPSIAVDAMKLGAAI